MRCIFTCFALKYSLVQYICASKRGFIWSVISLALIKMKTMENTLSLIFGLDFFFF